MNGLPNSPASSAAYDVARIRRDFPILDQQVYGKPLVYLDSAATAQKPQPVLDAINSYYTSDNANVHRGVHALSNRATTAYEGVREKARAFMNAASTKEIIFVRGTTEAINLVANSFVLPNLDNGDEIIITAMEHHSNIVPWQLVCERTGAKLRVAPMDENGDVILGDYRALFSDRTRFASLCYVSNAIGTLNPVAEMVEIAHSHDVPVMLDAAQATPHFQVDVRELDCDFLAFSGHKNYGPTGVGVLYGRQSRLESMPPYQGGGDMIASVTFEKTEYNSLPYKFEAGTPNIAAVIGLGTAIVYVKNVGFGPIMSYENDLVNYAVEVVGSTPGVHLIGRPKRRVSVVSFNIDGVHPHDAGTILDHEGIAIRTGHHCSQPVMDFFGVPATCRASFSLYNTRDEVDALVRGIGVVKEVMG